MKRKIVDRNRIHLFIQTIIGNDLHAKRVVSLANATTGLMHSATLGIHAIGKALAQDSGIKVKHAVKQVDRLLSNKA